MGVGLLGTDDREQPFHTKASAKFSALCLDSTETGVVSGLLVLWDEEIMGQGTNIGK